MLSNMPGQKKIPEKDIVQELAAAADVDPDEEEDLRCLQAELQAALEALDQELLRRGVGAEVSLPLWSLPAIKYSNFISIIKHDNIMRHQTSNLTSKRQS